MRMVSIVASRPRKKMIGSEIIMFFLGTDYSHVSWVFWSRNESRPFYYESVLAGGVKFTGERFWKEHNKVVYQKDFEISDEAYDGFLNSAMDLCGEEYSLLQNIGIQFSKWFRLAKNVFANSDDGSNCSELIFKFKDVVNLHVDSNADLATPKDIVEACLTLDRSNSITD